MRSPCGHHRAAPFSVPSTTSTSCNHQGCTVFGPLRRFDYVISRAAVFRSLISHRHSGLYCIGPLYRIAEVFITGLHRFGPLHHVDFLLSPGLHRFRSPVPLPRRHLQVPCTAPAFRAALSRFPVPHRRRLHQGRTVQVRCVIYIAAVIPYGAPSPKEPPPSPTRLPALRTYTLLFRLLQFVENMA